MASTLTVSVAVMHAGASVTVSLPAASVEYIEMELLAEVDNSGRYQYKADIILVVDSVSKHTSKPLADSVALADSSNRSVSKALTSSFSLQDSAQAVLVFIRAFADTPALYDAFASQLLKPVADSVSAADVSQRAYTKSLADAVGLNDGTSVGDGSTYSFTKSVNNATSVSDQHVKVTSKGLSDTFGFSDSGVVSMQSYCDITYFAEDYVGVASSF